MLPKYEKKSEDPSPLSLLTFHVFAELTACRSAQGVLSDRFLQVRII
jgi:hypothetical protein